MSRTTTDVGLGATLLVAILAAGSVLFTLVAPTQTMSAAGFTAAIGFGCLLIVVQHWTTAFAPSDSH